MKTMTSLKTQSPMHKNLITRSLGASLALAALMFDPGSAHAADSYFDVNGATVGSGVTSGTTYDTWNTMSYWSPSALGTAATVGWNPGDAAIFSAGTDADALNYQVNIATTTTINGSSIAKMGSGALTIQRGAFSVNNNETATIDLSSGIFDVEGTLNISTRTVVSGTAGLIKNGSGRLFFGGNTATYTGDTVVNAGTLSMTSARQPTTSRLVLNNSGVYQSYGAVNTVAGISGTSTASFVENGYSALGATITTSKASGEESYAGTVRDGATQVLDIVKSGAFTQRFSGDNTYTGSTTVTAGTLLVNGDSSSATGAVSVGAAGTLGGTGSIGGTTTLAAGGKLSAGDGNRDTLTFSNGLDISAVNDTGSLLFSLGTTGDSDQIASGALTIGAGLLGFDDFSFAAETGFGNGVYTLFSSTGITGSLDGTNLTGLVGGLDSTLSLSGNDVLLTVVPEPTTAGMLLLGLAMGMAARRRTSSALN